MTTLLKESWKLGAEDDLPLVVLAVYDDDERIFEALCAGACWSKATCLRKAFCTAVGDAANALLAVRVWRIFIGGQSVSL